MSEFKLKGASGKTYTIHARDINWEFDPSEDAMDETKDVVLIVLRIEEGETRPVDILYHSGPIKHYFKYRAQPDHVVNRTGARHYATLWRQSQEEMERIASDLQVALVGPEV
jgi:hypothetical protein